MSSTHIRSAAAGPLLRALRAVTRLGFLILLVSGGPPSRAGQLPADSGGSPTPAPAGVAASPAPAAPKDLSEMSLEELISVKVTSVSKKAEPLSEASAAIYVLTGVEIRRAGCTTVADALRLVPGIHVGRVTSDSWAVASRGFTSEVDNKLLVLIDGRSVYTPLFSGVYWDVQDLVLEDIDRIEVIRGPGATLWGINAVNGVINIITADSRATTGGLITAGGGDADRAFGTVRWGGRLGGNGAARVYAKGFRHQTALEPDDERFGGWWDAVRGGFRADLSPTGADSYTLQGDLYDTATDLELILPGAERGYEDTLGTRRDQAGGNLLGRWTHHLQTGSELALQVYFDHTGRHDSLFGEDRRTFDIDLQHSLRPRKDLGLVWGVGYRVTRDHLDRTSFVDIRGGRWSRTDDIPSAFAQGDLSLASDRLRVTVGTKLDHNDYSGFEIQPNARLAFTPAAGQSAWLAVSRAVRSPSRAEHDGRLAMYAMPPGDPKNPTAFPLVAVLIGDPDFRSEVLTSAEGGYRLLLTRRLSLDIAAYLSRYERLRTYRTGSLDFHVGADPYVELPLLLVNNLDATSHGAEGAVDWRPLSRLHVRAVYSYLGIRFDENECVGALGERSGTSPKHMGSVHASLDAGRATQLDLVLRFADRLADLGVDGYTTMDARVAWSPLRALELSLTGRDLLAPRHAEFMSESKRPSTVVERSGYAAATWRY